MSCNDCSCGGSCDTKEAKPARIITDKITLKNLNNIIYVNLDKDKVSKFEVIHFELFFLCPECGYTHKFEKDDASYYAIKFMANYPCITCGNISGFAGFMVRVSPDRGVDTCETTFITEEQFTSALQMIKVMRSNACNQIGHA